MNSNKFYEDYEKLKTVGQGAFGTATLYRRINDGKQVVMKEVLLLDMDYSEKRAALNEVEILSTLNHPNIIRYLGSFQKEGSLIIVMEYADGGNLAQLINVKRNKNEIFAEKSILNIMRQINAALNYMHSHKILHRDLKSANIFLNMSGNVKVGDFGISKMLNTRSQAQTVVGTPYYLSPEMCEGCDYNEKSDIWAMGCILYELACLRKPFEAMTLPVLVQKITNCEYKNIPETYSEELAHLVRSILQKNPAKRPSAKYVVDSVIPRIMKRNEAFGSSDMFSSTSSFKFGVSKERSILYKIYEFGTDQKIIPQELPHKSIIDFSVGSSHYVVVTADNVVYTWGENAYGQLGSGDTTRNRICAALVKSLQGEKIMKCAAGNNFSIFLNKEGILFSCGDGRQGCLGHGDWNSSPNPKIIDSLKHVTIAQICCGNDHVVALSIDGKVFTWGSSRCGQLGQGHMQYRCTPLAIKLLNMTKIKTIFCGENESVLLTTTGQVLVSGDNSYCKLGVPEQEKITLFTPVLFKDKIKYVSVGLNHSVMLTESGTIVALGRNSEGQLGKGNCNHYAYPVVVKLRKKIIMVGCGLNFTVAVDNRNVVWFWGSAYKPCKNVSVANTQKSMRSSNSVLPLTKNLNDTVKIKDLDVEESIDEFEVENGMMDRPPSTHYREREGASRATQILPRIVDISNNFIAIRENVLIRFYSSANNVKSGNIIYAADIKIKFNNLFILTHTTVPPPIQQFTERNFNSQSSMSQVAGTTIAPTTLSNLPNMTNF